LVLKKKGTRTEKEGRESGTHGGGEKNTTKRRTYWEWVGCVIIYGGGPVTGRGKCEKALSRHSQGARFSRGDCMVVGGVHGEKKIVKKGD